jgi:hypothetical protein
MSTITTLLRKIQHTSIHCDDLCLIGYIKRGTELILINSSFVLTENNADSVSLFNFCPGCGQELNIETQQKFTEIVKFKENK